MRPTKMRLTALLLSCLLLNVGALAQSTTTYDGVPIPGAKIIDGTITAAKIGAGAITAEKLEDGLAVVDADLVLGASGTPGTLTVYPTTASKGYWKRYATDANGGNYVLSEYSGAQTGNRSLTWPVGTTNMVPALSSQAQSFTGTQTFVAIVGSAGISGFTTFAHTGDDTWTAATPRITITNGETITWHDGTNTLGTLADGGTTGNLGITGTITAGTGLTVTTGDASIVTATASGAATLTKSSNTGAVALRLGATVTEGAEFMVFDKEIACSGAVETAVVTIPAHTMPISFQANAQTTITSGGTTTQWGIGFTAVGGTYGVSGDLVKNSKTDDVYVTASADPSASLAIVITGLAVDGETDGDTGLTGTIRVRIVWIALNSLDDAP